MSSVLDVSASPNSVRRPEAIGGVQKVADVAVHPGEDSTLDRMLVAPKYSGVYISSATTTVVKTGAGIFGKITLGETAAGAITIYDNTAGSGTVISVLKASIAEGTYVFDRAFANGLTIVTAAASKLHVSYL